MTGWTFCVMFSEMATMEHVSCRTATRLGPRQRVSPQSHPTETRPAPPSLPPSPGAGLSPGQGHSSAGPHPGQVWLGSKRMSRVGS